MSDDKINIIRLEKSSQLSPKVAYWYTMMENVRNRLISIIVNIEEETLDFSPNEEKFETIGTLLLHIAAIEWSWIFEDIEGLEMNFEDFKHAFALRPDVNIPQIKGKTKQFYLDKLNEVRKQVCTRLLDLTDEELEKIVGSDTEKFTIEWILFHIIEHEMMHIGQILFLKRLFETRKSS